MDLTGKKEKKKIHNKRLNMAKRGKDHTWELTQYNGDIAIYARCKCKFHYNCGRSRREEDGSWSVKQYPTVFYNYCPSCGAKKKWKTEDVTKLDKYEFNDF